MPVELWQTRPIEDTLRAELAQLREELRWIPVTERVPEMHQTIYTYSDAPDSETYDCGWYCGANDAGQHRAQDGEYFWKFTHWRVPLPPKEEERGN